MWMPNTRFRRVHRVQIPGPYACDACFRGGSAATEAAASRERLQRRRQARQSGAASSR